MDVTWFAARVRRLSIGFGFALLVGLLAEVPLHAATPSGTPSQLREGVVTAARREEAADEFYRDYVDRFLREFDATARSPPSGCRGRWPTRRMI